MTLAMKPARLEQDAVVAALKGQKLRVPDLAAHFRAWPPAQLHPRYEAVVPVVDAAIDRIAASAAAAAATTTAAGGESLLRRMRDEDVAGAVCYFYPQASDRDIETLALVMLWVVCWDDVVDAGEGDLANDWEGAERWRARTLQVIRGALGVGGEATWEQQQVDAINVPFQEFGDRLRQKCPEQLRRRVYDGIEFYVKSCGVEQKHRLDRCIPDYDSYMRFRLGTIAGDFFCSLVECTIQEALPGCVAAEVPQLSEQVGIMFAFINDMLSLKKELRTDCVLNAVAALLTPEKSLDEVVGELNDKLRQAVADFDSVAGNMLARVEGDEALTNVVQTYIDGCRAFVTGTLAFTLSSPRYNLAKLLKEDGSLEVVL